MDECVHGWMIFCMDEFHLWFGLNINLLDEIHPWLKEK